MMSFIAGIIFLFHSVAIFANAPPVVLKDNQSFYEINLNLDILKDPSGQLTINDVIQPKWASQFKKNEIRICRYFLLSSL